VTTLMASPLFDLAYGRTPLPHGATARVS
jgi:hypothetical protein